MVPKGRAGWVLDCTTAQENEVWRLPLGQYPTVFQAAVFAILYCAETLMSEKEAGRRFSICSNSQAAIRAVGKPEISSILVWECKKALNQLAELNNVALIWVSGHSGIKGNEKADQLVKKGAAGKPIGPEPILGLAPCCTKLTIKKLGRGETQRMLGSSKRLSSG